MDVARKYIAEVPEDILPQIQAGITPEARPSKGEWVLIYGGTLLILAPWELQRSYIHADMKEASSITAQILIQLVKLAGLKVIGVANLQKHRELLESLGTGA